MDKDERRLETGKKDGDGEEIDLEKERVLIGKEAKVLRGY